MRPTKATGIRGRRFGPILVAIVTLGRVLDATAVTSAQQISVSELIRQLEDEDEVVRVSAADALGTLGPKARSAIPALTKALGHKDERLRWHAARALSVFGPDAKDAVPVLASLLKDENPLVRAHAAHTLGRIGAPSKAIVSDLAPALTDSDPRVRRAVVQAFERIRPGAKVSIPLLVKVLEDAEPSVVMPALHTLAEAGASAVPLMIEALKNGEACYWACRVLGEVGPAAASSAPALAAVLSSPEPEVRMHALLALAEIGPAASSAVPSILGRLEDQQSAVRHSAAYALGRIESKQADPALRRTAQSKDPVLRMISRWALASIHPKDANELKQAVQLIFEVFKNEDPEVRNVAATLLVDLKPAPKLVAPAIVPMLREQTRTCGPT